MGPLDDFLKAGITGREMPVNPPPHPFYLTKDPRVYNLMMRATYTYLKECAVAQIKMYDEFLKHIPEI
jgi:hypothetical protein